MKLPFGYNIKIGKAVTKSSGKNQMLSLTDKEQKEFDTFLNRISRGTKVFKPTTENFINEGFLSNVDTFSITNDLGVNASSLPRIVEQQQAGGKWVELLDTPFHEYMKNPNLEKGTTWQDLEYQRRIWLLVTGNSYSVNMDAGLGKLSSDNLPSQAVCINTNGDFFDPIRNYTFNAQKTYNFDKEKIIHVKYFNPSEKIDEMVYGISPLRSALFVVQTGNDRWEANASVLQNKGMIGVMTDKSEYSMTNEEWEEYQTKGLERMGGPEKFGQVYMSRKNLDFVRMAMSTVDLGLLDMSPLTLRALCSAYGVDSVLYNDPDNTTYNNLSEAQKRYYTNAIQPLNNRFDAAYTSQLIPSFFSNPSKIRTRTDYSNVEALQKDKLAEAKYWDINVKNGTQSAVQSAAGQGLEAPDKDAKPLIGGSNNNSDEEKKQD